MNRTPFKNPIVVFPWKPADEEHALNTPYEFEWKPNRNFCLTMKLSLDFECAAATNDDEDDNKFLSFALRKSGLIVLKYYKTEEEVNRDRVWAFCPWDYNLFLWNRDGECVNGAY